MVYLDIVEQISNEERKKRKYNNLLDKINSTESKINNVVFPKREDMPNVDVSCCPQDLINSRMEFVTDDVKWLRKEANRGVEGLSGLREEVKRKINNCTYRIRELERKRNESGL